MIIITGANGKLGRKVVEQLRTRIPIEQIGVSVRDPDQAQELKELGVRVRQGDFNNAESLAHAFEGASQVLIVSSNTGGKETVRQHHAAIESAKQAGASRILYTSQIAASPTSLFRPAVDHAATEALLHDSGVPFTSLRNGYYATTTLWLLANALKTGELAAPEDGPVSWTAHDDLAEATAIILNGQGIEGVTPALTASEAIDLEGVAALAAELTQRSIRRIIVADDEYRAGLLAQGSPEATADLLLGMFRASRRGEFAQVDPTLARLINRPPVPLRDILKAALAPAEIG